MGNGKPDWWDLAVDYLKDDELLGPIVEKYHDGYLESKDDLFQTTIRSIVGQQISVIAADAIWGRLVEKLESVNPENVLKFTKEEIAKCGLTRPKSNYIYGLAEQSKLLLEMDWDNMSDKEIKTHLIQFKGIGPWTAEMMLMFSFTRPDVFSIGDIALIRAIKMLVPDVGSNESIEKLAKRWSPYRTAACWYLWRMLDPVPVAY